jgi:hypothetical protein
MYEMGFDMREYTTINFDGMRRDYAALMGFGIMHATYTEMKCTYSTIYSSVHNSMGA